MSKNFEDTLETVAELFGLAYSPRSKGQDKFEKSLLGALAKLEEPERTKVSDLISRILPVASLIPDEYQEWRPVICDAFAYFFSHLSAERLAPKLIEQLTQPDDVEFEQRLVILISQMPALQRVVQTVAHNPRLSPAFRAELTELGNSARDITPAEAEEEIKRQLGGGLDKYGVELGQVNLTETSTSTETSISATVRFTWHNPDTLEREPGVFKLLKPYVLDHLPEELRLLWDSVNFIDQNHEKYGGALRKVMDEVRGLIAQEIDLIHEQEALGAAHQRYREVPGVRVPVLIDALSTAEITALTEEAGVRVTDAFLDRPEQRKSLAESLIETLIAAPLYAEEEFAYIHADLHADHLRVDEESGELILPDWSQVERLSREQRRYTVMLTLAVVWRDSRRVHEAISALCADDLSGDKAKTALVQGTIHEFFSELSPFHVPDYIQIASLLDMIGLRGIRVPKALLSFLKTVYTLREVLNEISPEVKMHPVVARYALRILLKESPNRLKRFALDSSPNFDSHLSNYDLTLLAVGLPLLGGRLSLQAIKSISDGGLDGIRQGLGRLTQPPDGESMASSGQAGYRKFLDVVKSIKRPTFRVVNKP